MNEVSTDQLRRAVEAQHGGTATLVQSVPVHEKIQIETHRGNATHKEERTVWEGVVHVFDLAGHPKASRAYAWSS